MTSAAMRTEAVPADGVPATGQLVTVRNRQWIVTDVSRSSIAAEDPRRAAGAAAPHLVVLVSVEDDAHDEELRVVWELEQGVVVHAWPGASQRSAGEPPNELLTTNGPPPPRGRGFRASAIDVAPAPRHCVGQRARRVASGVLATDQHVS
ncbi:MULTISPECIES: hypothetical protein [Streptomyces]|uniref:hypothetical protein n=1 Tax=Streptomyces TaxID=1883 RepID=UPI00341D2177